MRILHVGRNHAHLTHEGVPRSGVTMEGMTHLRVVPRAPHMARGLSVDHIVWHTGWDDELSIERREQVIAEVAPVTYGRSTT